MGGDEVFVFGLVWLLSSCSNWSDSLLNDGDVTWSGRGCGVGGGGC